MFKITAVRMYRKTRFPTTAVRPCVRGPAPPHHLGGTFDYARHSYLSNVVVYAVAVVS